MRNNRHFGKNWSLCLLFGAPFLFAYSGSAQKNTTKPVLNSDAELQERFQKLPPDEKQKICDSDWGTLFPECWQLVGAAWALNYAFRTPEPLPPIAIEALERTYPQIFSHDHRIATSALLYRYGKPQARKYLLQQLNDYMDWEAGTILMLNQDEEALPAILKTLRRYHKPDMVSLAGKWKHPEIRATLVETFRTAFKNKESGCGRFFNPLAEQDATEAIPDITRFFNEVSLNQSAAHLDAAAALIRLKSPDHRKMLNYLTQLLFTEVPQNVVEEKLSPMQKEALGAFKWQIIEALGNTGDPLAVKAIEKVIQHYLQSDDTTYLGQPADEIAVVAARTLPVLKATNSGTLVEKLIVRLKNRNSKLLDAKTGWILMELDAKKHEAFLVSTFGSDWVKREKEKLTLKKLPERYLPQSSTQPVN